MDTRRALTPMEQTDIAVEFDEFVRARSPALFRTAVALTADPQLAEDLLQTALAKAWRSWGRVHTSHETFVRRTLVNTYVSWWRLKSSSERPSSDLPHRAFVGPDTEGRLDLRDAVRRLPRRQQAVIVLRYFEDLPDNEIAELMGCSASTVRSQAHRALDRLSRTENLGDRP